MNEDFFDSQTASSKIKALIVADYFPKYCRILLKNPQSKIVYLDLFSGPGIYNDGKHSTPLLIGKACAEDAALSQKVQLLFNDNDYKEQLEKNFKDHFPDGSFYYPPRFANKTVGEDDDIAKYLSKEPDPNKKTNETPTLLFFDPFGYSTIETKILVTFLKHWGNELFLFVNIKRIHAALENPKFDDLVRKIFPTKLDQVRNDRKYKPKSQERVNLLIESLADEFKEALGKTLYSCVFKFQEEDSNTTSHCIIHFTKHKKGFELVKQIYYDFDNIGANLEKAGYYSFDAKRMFSKDGLDFSDQNVDELADLLIKEYKGKTRTALSVFNHHHPKHNFCGTLYAKALRHLVSQGKATAVFTDNVEHRVPVTLSDFCKITFH